MRKRIWIFPLAMCSLLLLVGFGTKKVELLNDTKLIDLEKAIEVARPGGNSLVNTDHNEDGEDNPEGGGAEDSSPENGKRIITISVRGEAITYDKASKVTKEELVMNVRRDNGRSVSFRLEDDFAEAHVYKEIIELFQGLKRSLILDFTYER